MNFNEFLNKGYTPETAWNLMNNNERDNYFKIFNEKYPNVPGDMFAFPEGIGLPKEFERKYPIDDAHIKPAVSYFNMPKNRESALEIITKEQWEEGGKRIAKRATEYYEKKYIFDKETQTVRKE